VAEIELENLTTPDLKRKFLLGALNGDFDVPGTEVDPSLIHVDETVGKRIFIGDTMVYGDTGWSPIARWSNGEITLGALPSGLAPRGTVQGGVFIRRINTEVHFAITEAIVTAVNPEFTSIPVGYRSGGFPYPALPLVYRFGGDATPQLGILEVGASVYRFRVPVNAILAGVGSGGYGPQFSWVTDNPWPTALPDAAV